MFPDRLSLAEASLGEAGYAADSAPQTGSLSLAYVFRAPRCRRGRLMRLNALPACDRCSGLLRVGHLSVRCRPAACPLCRAASLRRGWSELGSGRWLVCWRGGRWRATVEGPGLRGDQRQVTGGGAATYAGTPRRRSACCTIVGP
jgi:hypothetical protein